MSSSAKFAVVAGAVLMLAAMTVAQKATPSRERKVTTRVAPDYPVLAKRMHLQGAVKVEAVVRSNGTVKSTRALGGNPVLVDAALIAVGKWKFESAQNESTEIVQLTFTSP